MCIVNLNNTSTGIAVQVKNGVMEVGLNEVVGCLSVGQLP